jgi:uncharacterized protein YkwD
MGAFAGAFLAAVGSVVTWGDEVGGVRATTAVASTTVPAEALPEPAQLLLPSPSPPVRPSPSPAAQRAELASIAAAPSRSASGTGRPTSIVIGSYQQTLINQDRAAAGLPPLTWSSCLASVAQQQASRMAAAGYMAHANGITEDLNCGLGGVAGENLGYWTGGVNDVQLNSMFMASSEHRANILGNYRYVGTCWAVAPNGTAYLAVEFES